MRGDAVSLSVSRHRRTSADRGGAHSLSVSHCSRAEDDDWEADDFDAKLKLPDKEKEEWSDEEGHEAHLKPDADARERLRPVRATSPRPRTATPVLPTLPTACSSR